MNAIVTEKQCSKCKTFKSLDCFWVDRIRKDGLTPQCKDCQKAVSKIHREKTRDIKNAKNKERYYKDVEKSRARARTHAKKHREKNPIKYYKYQVEWRKSNKDKFLIYQKTYYQKHPEKRKLAHIEWKRKHPGIERQYKATRRARKYKAEGTFTAKEFKELCEKYHNICLCCGQSKKLVADHVIPLAKGGRNSIDNIQPLCHSCNSRKHIDTTDYR